MPARRRIVALIAGSLLAASLTACAGDWDPRPAPAPIGELGAGFEPSSPPSPEATIVPEPGSWDEVHPAPGYRVVLLTAGDDPPTRALADAVRAWAEEERVELREVAADDDLVAGIVEAMELNPDLIVSTGNDLVDPLAVVTASHLDRQFLVLGAEVAEPTHNVTAVDWTGASYRGEGLGMPSAYDEASFTPERAGRAIRAGTAAVLHGLTGIVIWID
ncbi:MAG: hypothetical protein QM598_14305 [Protaetiibacter sp.]